MIRKKNIIRKSTRYNGPLECTDRISTYGCLTWNGRKPPPANPADLVVSSQYSTGARCRKWAHYCASTPTTSPPLPSHYWTNPLSTTCAGLTGCPPTHPQPSSSPSHKLLYSCTSLPNRTLNTLCCFTLHCLNVNEDMIQFTVNCLKMHAVVKRLVQHKKWKPIHLEWYQALQIVVVLLTRFWDVFSQHFHWNYFLQKKFMVCWLFIITGTLLNF